MSIKSPDPSREQALVCWRTELKRSGWTTSAGQELVATTEICGRVSAAALFARRSVPHYPAAAMDGIAVRAADTEGASRENPKQLRAVSCKHELRSGEACIVDTGDVAPCGADAVVMKEYVKVAGDFFQLSEPVSAGRHIRSIGEDIREGCLLLPAGRMLGPTDIAACLAAGIEELPVFARPIVTVIPSGDEIVDSAGKLEPGQIRDVNSHMLKALMGSWGASVRRHPVVKDNYASICEAVATAVKDSDMVVLNAGTSQGTEDFSAAALRELGRVLTHGVAIRPGRPVVLAVVAGKPVVGLPGYPASCLLTAHLFLRDLLLEWQQKPTGKQATMSAKVALDVRSAAGVEEFVRVEVRREQDGIVAVPLPRGASLISSLTAADGWIRIPMDRDEIAQGETVLVEYLRDAGIGGVLK